MPLLIALFVFFSSLPNAYAIDTALSITQKECERLIKKHTVSGADYVPSKDARGHDVVPADLNGAAQIKIPDEIIFNIGVDLEEKYGLGTAGQYTGTTTLGQIKVKGRKIYWNDQLLNQDDSAAILAACKENYAN